MKEQELTEWQKDLTQRIQDLQDKVQDTRTSYLITMALVAILILANWLFKYYR